MKAYVMSAGVGTRLEPLTLAVPKPLVPICNIPVMQYNILHLKKHGITDITANLHYFPEQIKDYFKDGSQFGVKINYSFEEKLLGTAGGILKMARLNPPAKDYFFVLSSDVLMNINLKELLSFHEKNHSLVTIGLIEVPDPTGLGVVLVDKNCRISAFQEKPKKEEAKSRLINTGVYVFDKKILEIIENNKFFDFGNNVFPYLIQCGIPFYGFKADAYWKDVGSPANYFKANFDVASGKIKMFESNRIEDAEKISPKAKISKKAIIGPGCFIEDNAEIRGASVIGDGCTIKNGSLVADSIIWSKTAIGEHVKIDSSIIGSLCDIQDGADISSNCIIANRCSIKAKASLQPNTKLTPGTSL